MNKPAFIGQDRVEDLRLFYNHTIYPELKRLERKRLRLIAFLLISLVLIAGIIAFEIYVGELLVTLLLAVPLTLYSYYLVQQIRHFVADFKPKIVRLILDFIDNEVNFGTLYYEAKQGIKKNEFLASQLFIPQKEHSYESEDRITGTVGEAKFVMSEVRLQEVSPVKNQLNRLFQGIFLVTHFNLNQHEQAIVKEGKVMVVPRSRRAFLTKSIREFTFTKGSNQDKEINNVRFRELFATYAAGEAHVNGFLTDPLQEALVRYHDFYKTNIYFSVINQVVFVAIENNTDILEPSIWKSNMNFVTILTFYQDIYALLDIVRIFDQTR